MRVDSYHPWTDKSDNWLKGIYSLSLFLFICFLFSTPFYFYCLRHLAITLILDLCISSVHSRLIYFSIICELLQKVLMFRWHRTKGRSFCIFIKLILRPLAWCPDKRCVDGTTFLSVKIQPLHWKLRAELPYKHPKHVQLLLTAKFIDLPRFHTMAKLWWWTST